MSRRASYNPSVKLSKSLSWLLRHGAEKEGFKFLPGGFLYVDTILQKPQFSGYIVEDVKSIVETNDKQRFHLEEEEGTGRLKIRANQGHSLQVPDLQLDPITSAEDFPVVIHGTYYKFWESIRRQGLKRMSRTHVHFAAGEPGESGVISGMRGSCDMLIHLDLAKALAGGLQFFRSANNVILCEGDKDGVIPPRFFWKVVDRKTGKPVDVEGPSKLPDEKSRPSRPQLDQRSKLPDEEGRPSRVPLETHLAAMEMEDLPHETCHRRKSRKRNKDIERAMLD